MGEYGPYAGRIYIGNLPDDVRRSEIEDLLHKYGRIRDIDIKYGKTSNGTAYAFVEFEDPRDAEDAVKGRDGTRFDRMRLRVEFAASSGSRRSRGSALGPPRRSEYRVVVTGLPPSASWQDLKDLMRQVGNVGYANIEADEGIVEYETRREMEAAIRKLDKTEFKNPFHTCAIRVRQDRRGSRGRSPSHSRSRVNRSESRSRSRGRRYSKSQSKSRSRSRSRDHKKRRERSRDRSRDRSHARSESEEEKKTRKDRHSSRDDPPRRSGRDTADRSRSPGKGEKRRSPSPTRKSRRSASRSTSPVNGAAKRDSRSRSPNRQKASRDPSRSRSPARSKSRSRSNAKRSTTSSKRSSE